MNTNILGKSNKPLPKQFYHGTRIDLKTGDLVDPLESLDAGDKNITPGHIYLTSNLDEAIWDAEIGDGEGHARVYVVEPIGAIRDTSDLPGWQAPSHPSMSCYSHEPLRITGEVTEWPLYHGTRADLGLGNLIKTGHRPNFGNKTRTTNYVYLARTLDAAIWGAELASGKGPCRIYIVEPTGPIEDDPNLTNAKFRGNPTKSFRSREPLRIAGEVIDWQGHSPDAIKSMKDGIERLERLGIEPIDD